MSTKHYFVCLRRHTADTWHCTQETASNIVKGYDFIIPLDRKPRKAEIKEG